MAIDLKNFEQLRASGDLPSPRGVALEIMRLAGKEESGLPQITRIARTDPAFVGRLIKAANGLVAMTRRPVVSVQEALMVLGLPAVRNMALGFSLLSDYNQGQCRHFDYGEFWSSSLLIGLSAQHVCMRTRLAAPDEMFSLGLLSRVGELALATLHPAQYSTVLEEWRRFPQFRLTELEERAFAMNHRELGAAMLADWGIPRIFTEPTFFFGRPEQAGFTEGSRQYAILRALCLGKCIAQVCLLDNDEKPRAMQRVMEEGSLIGLEPETLVSLCEKVGAEWLEWSRLLKLKTEGRTALPPFAQMARLGTGLLTKGVSVEPSLTDLPATDDAISAELLEAPVKSREQARPIRVLVIGRDLKALPMLSQTLEQAGHEVVHTTETSQGLNIAIDVQPDMMVIDVEPPGQEGLALVTALRQTRFGRTVYILMLTHREDEPFMVEAFEAGVDDYVVKPLGARMLAARLRAGQRVVRLQQELERDREEIRHYAAELAVSNRRLQEAALTDPLTGFPNRRYAIDRIQKEWSISQRTQRPLSCMVIDIDNFKQINDLHGHDVGDTVLKVASATFRTAVRSQDVIARTGGDEFLVICPETSLEAALLVGERLRSAIAELRVDIGSSHPPLSLSCSTGVAVRDTGMGDPDMLIKRADEGAYSAKRQGRNRVATVQVP
jgi:two-component system, cell cycle response regulator